MATLRAKPLFLLGIGAIGIGLHRGTYMLGFQHMPAYQVVAILYAFPVFMMVISRALYNEHFFWRSWGFISLGFLGILCLASAKGSLLSLTINVGLGLILTSAVSWALFSVLIKHRQQDPVLGMFWCNLGGLLFMLAIAPHFMFTTQFSAPQIAGILFLAIGPNAAGLVFWGLALSRVKKTETCANLALLTPVLSILWISIGLKELILPLHLLGIVLVIGSAFLNLNFGKVSDPVVEL